MQRHGPRDELLGLLRAKLAFARDLESHGAVELRILGLPDGPKGPGAQLLDQLEMPEGLPSVQAAAFALVRQCLVADEAEVAAAGRADDLGQRGVIYDLDRVAAMRAADVQGVGRRRVVRLGQGPICATTVIQRREGVCDRVLVVREPFPVLALVDRFAGCPPIMQIDGQQLAEERNPGLLRQRTQVIFDPRPLPGLPGRLEAVADGVDLGRE